MVDVLSIEVDAATLGAAVDQADAAAFYDWGNSDNWDHPGGPYPHGKISLGFTGFGNLPHYDFAAATTTIKAYWYDYVSNTGNYATIPWNPAWLTGVPLGEGDAFLMISDGLTDPVRNEGYELWRVYGTFSMGEWRPWGPQFLDAFQAVWARGWRPGDLLVGQVHHRTADLANVGYQGHGGAATPLLAGTLLAAEIQAAIDDTTWVVPHAITVAGMNPCNGSYAVAHNEFRAPGNRVEHTTHDTVYPSIDISPSAKLYKEGVRIRIVKSEVEIDAWIAGLGLTGTALGKCKKVVAMTMARYGFVLWETGFGYPLIYADAIGYGPAEPTWVGLGVTSSLIAANILEDLVGSADDFEVVEPAPAVMDEVVIPPTVPDAPVGSVGTVGVGSLSFTWSTPADGGAALTEYEVFFGPTSGSLPSVGTVGAGSHARSFSGLTPGTSYYFAVLARNSEGDSPPSGEVSAVPLVEGGVVTALTDCTDSCEFALDDAERLTLRLDPDGGLSCGEAGLRYDGFDSWFDEGSSGPWADTGDLAAGILNPTTANNSITGLVDMDAPAYGIGGPAGSWWTMRMRAYGQMHLLSPAAASECTLELLVSYDWVNFHPLHNTSYFTEAGGNVGYHSWQRTAYQGFPGGTLLNPRFRINYLHKGGDDALFLIVPFIRYQFTVHREA